MRQAQIKRLKDIPEAARKGDGKEKSPRIANAAAGSSRGKVGSKGGKSPSCEDWPKPDLLKRARYRRQRTFIDE
jgi:hypothetical protein